MSSPRASLFSPRKGDQVAGQAAKKDKKGKIREPEKGQTDPAKEKTGPEKDNTDSDSGDSQAEHGKPILAVDNGGHIDRVSSFDFTPDGKKLITLSQDNTIQVWDAGSRERQQILRLPLHSGIKKKSSVGFEGIVGERSFVLSGPEGKTVLMRSNQQISEQSKQIGDWLLVHVESGKIMRIPGLPREIRFQHVPVPSPDGDALAVTAATEHKWKNALLIVSGLKNVWQPEPPPLTVVKLHEAEAFHDVRFSPDGSRLAGCVVELATVKMKVTKKTHVAVWNLKNASAAPKNLKTKMPATLGLAWSVKGSRLAAVSGDAHRMLDVWTAEGLLLRTMAFDAPTMESPMNSPVLLRRRERGAGRGGLGRQEPGRHFAVRRAEGTLRGNPAFQLPHYPWRSGIIAPDGQRLVTAGGKKVAMGKKREEREARQERRTGRRRCQR